MQPGYGPEYFASAVLADGRLVVIGGEYNIPCTSSRIETTLGAIYDPTTNTWTPLSAPNGWLAIGDAPNTVLPDGEFLLATIFSPHLVAKLNPSTLTWTMLGPAPTSAEEA